MKKSASFVFGALPLAFALHLGACGSDSPGGGFAGRDGGEDGGTGGGEADGGDGGTGGPTTGPTTTSTTGEGGVVLGCGDGEADVEAGTEECDDGNVVGGDGCSEDCEIEQGWLCPPEGGACAANCGDGTLLGVEQCDDGNVDDGDGCSKSCELEEGYACPAAGMPCIAAQCGDGVIAGDEECEDGDRTPGDGCDLNCQQEEGWLCVGAVCSAAACGDGIRAGDEGCDDGGYCVGGADDGERCTAGADCESGDCQPRGGDGCLADCSAREPLYVCPPGGGACNKAPGIVCGNRIVTPDEQCDDGNAIDGDGCTDCLVDSGFECAGGTSCSAVCGDGQVVGPEECDDGGYCVGGGDDGDPCLADADCEMRCEPAGDDGCTAGCRFEPGFKCDDPGMPCEPAVCGNGVREGLEQCDDGDPTGGPDNELGDGCTPLCTREPECADGVCVATCGDGIRDDAEQCDDGNNQSFDGCSASCEVEAGFACSDVTEDPPECVELPIVFRDFKAHDDDSGSFQHADMRRRNRPSTSPADDDDLVLMELGWDLNDDGMPDAPASVPAGVAPGPIYNQADKGANGTGSHTTFGTVWFNRWYRDNDYAQTVVETLTLCDDVSQSPYPDNIVPSDSGNPAPVAGDGVYTFGDSTFYPLDGRGWQDPSLPAGQREEYYSDGGPTNGCNLDTTGDPDAGGLHNFMFTSELRFWFTYEGSEVLTFNGDDDVWVFINGHRVVDLGGIHCAEFASVDLSMVANEVGLEEGKVYEVVVYQAERNPVLSSYRLDLGNFLARTSECVSICGDGIRTADELCDEGSLCAGGDLDGEACLEDGDCTGGGDCVSQNDGGYGRCSPDCQDRGRYCGDGMLDAANGEECDDGALENDGSYGGCNPDCTLGPVCGDGEVSFTEQCDDGDDNADDTYGVCQTDCTLGPRCGDGTRQQSEGEQCDDGINAAAYDGCAPGCVRAPYCGDGKRQRAFGEQCDEGEGDNDGAYGGCNDDCSRAPFCGDGRIDADAGEECDDGNANDFDGCDSECQRENILI